jgi:chromate transporter
MQALKAYQLSINNTITRIVMVTAMIITVAFFTTPWTIPALILAGGIATSFSEKRIPQVGIPAKKIKWGNIWLFAFIFLLAGALSETARKNDWPNRRPLNLFENTYRSGSLVFGGGQVLIPMMFEQFVVRPQTEYVLRKIPM